MQLNNAFLRLAIPSLAATLSLTGCQKTPQSPEHRTTSQGQTVAPATDNPNLSPSPPTTPSPPLVTAARSQIGVTTSYDPTYRNIAFPMGDVSNNTGVCTDVVIRAYRQQGKDLQQLVNTDMKQAWQAYPNTWGLTQPDTNIDHRRVPNLEVFFSRHGKRLSISDKSSFQAGDLVTWRLNQGNKKLPHIGIVSDKKAVDGTPLILHNIGRGTEESNILYEYPITGHYRY